MIWISEGQIDYLYVKKKKKLILKCGEEIKLTGKLTEN